MGAYELLSVHATDEEASNPGMRPTHGTSRLCGIVFPCFVSMLMQCACFGSPPSNDLISLRFFRALSVLTWSSSVFFDGFAFLCVEFSE